MKPCRNIKPLEQESRGTWSRRELMALAASGLLVGRRRASAAIGAAIGADEWRLGAQSYSFRQFDLEGAIAQLQALGLDTIEFCSRHFAAEPDATTINELRRHFGQLALHTPSYGVVGFGGDAARNRQRFEFASALGLDQLAADPSVEALSQLEELCEEFGTGIAIHNHGPGSRYNYVEQTLRAVDGRHPLLGACVDTGHALRTPERPDEVVRALGERVRSVHLKDWISGGDEQIVGEGDLDLAALVDALRAVHFDGPIFLEYEEHPDDPVPHMQRGLANWRQAVDG